MKYAIAALLATVTANYIDDEEYGLMDLYADIDDDVYDYDLLLLDADE